MLRKVRAYKACKVQRCDNYLQLLLNLEVELPNGDLKVLKVLVDTGAEANLVKKKLIPSRLMFAAEKPLKLVTANGKLLGGGDTCVNLNMRFFQVVNGNQLPALLRRHAIFYDADIRVDAILSHPWMVENKIGVFPHLHAMALEKPRLTLLFGESQKTHKNSVKAKRENQWRNCRVTGVEK